VNIFVLDPDPDRCARYHTDTHVVKMTLEGAQILCTASSRHGVPGPYRPTHANHPCTLWAGDSLSNWRWLRRLTLALGREYTHRFRRARPHASAAVAEMLREPPIPDRGLLPFAQAMPVMYRMEEDPVAAYRLYYAAEKVAGARWTGRRKPAWLAEALSRTGSPGRGTPT
jgi:hypothetical protein